MVSSWSPGATRELLELTARGEVVAVGECGLDFDHDFSPRAAQVECFEAQLELAAEVKKTGLPSDDLAAHTTATARALFGL